MKKILQFLQLFKWPLLEPKMFIVRWLVGTTKLIYSYCVATITGIRVPNWKFNFTTHLTQEKILWALVILQK